jgi:hypothetical protein
MSLALATTVLAGIMQATPTPGDVPKDCSTSPSSSTDAKAWGTIVTVASGPDVDGALQCVAGLLTGSSRNATTKQAFENAWNGATSTDSGVIVGHGLPGIVCTGFGDDCLAKGRPADAVMRHNNVNNWVGYAQSRRSTPTSALRLLSCGAGANAEGANLLAAIANATQTVVLAPTSFVYCGGGRIWLDEGGCWQKAEPGKTPPSIPAPKITVSPSPVFQFKLGGKIQPVRSVKLLSLADAANRLVPSAHKASLLRLVDFASPFQPGGVPLAIVTGRMLVEIVAQDGVTTIRRLLLIYNDALAQDSSYPEIFYRIDSSFALALKG